MTQFGVSARLSTFAPSYWVVQFADRTTGDPEITAFMREELQRQVKIGLPRADLRSQFSVLMVSYFVLMLPASLLGWGATKLIPTQFMSGAALGFLAFAGLAAIAYGVRWLVSPGDQKIVVGRPWVLDAALIAVALTVGFSANR